MIVTALAAGESHACALVSSGRVICWGYNGNGELGVGSSQNIGVNFTAVDLGTGDRVVKSPHLLHPIAFLFMNLADVHQFVSAIATLKLA